MGTGILSSTHGTGKLAASQLQGNSGKFIVILIRRRTDSKIEPTIITEGLWQIVKAVPGTWLTAVAKYGEGLNWPDKHLHRVYFNEYVQACKPGPDDTKADYKFFDFDEGGAWEDGIDKPPKEPGARDLQVEVDSYWGFKIIEVVIYQKPDIGEDELLKRRKKLIDFSFEKALASAQKKELLEDLEKLEKAVEKLDKSKLNEEQKLKEFQKFLEELNEKIKNKAVDEDVAGIIQGWFRYAEKALNESIEIKGRMGDRIKKELEYLKFRCAEYDMIREGEQEVKEVQKGTDKEDQWKKMLPLLPLKKPEEKKQLYKRKPKINTPTPSSTTPADSEEPPGPVA